MFDVEYGHFDKLNVEFHSKHRYFNPSLEYNAENKGPECTITYNNIESRFSNHVLISTLNSI